LARLLRCAPDEVALLDSATRAWDMAFHAVPLRPGDRILTSRAEYASNVIAFLAAARRHGAVIEVVADDGHGQLDVADLRQRLGTGGPVALVAVTHAPTQGGLVNPAAAIGAATREAGMLFLLDACQSVGQLDVDVEAIGCDLLSATGRKFLRAPRGTAFLVVRRAVLERLDPPFLDLHSATWTGPSTVRMRDDARRFETWESSIAGRLGLGVAADYALALGMPAIEERVTGLAEGLRARLASEPGVSVHDQGVQRSGSVSCSVDGVPAEEVVAELRAQGINTSVTRPEYARYDLPERGLGPLVRASVHYYTTEAELDAFVAALPRR
jgi:selenocysteine lyase/cysteine desulfurase